ncbi:unnamed protein product, partial [Prorocentrum cordatum]
PAAGGLARRRPAAGAAVAAEGTSPAATAWPPWLRGRAAARRGGALEGHELLGQLLPAVPAGPAPRQGGARALRRGGGRDARRARTQTRALGVQNRRHVAQAEAQRLVPQG